MKRFLPVFLLIFTSRILAAPTEASDSPASAGSGPATQPVPLLSAEDAAKTFNLPKGFHAEVVASEPLIEHPVAAAFDPDGKLYVVEMRGYMPDVDGKGEDQPTGRISVLEDTDHDGRMDKVTVFLDHLVLPRAVGIANGGVLIGVPPNLIFCTIGKDGKCDKQTILATDYISPSKNPEDYPNGMLRDIDNWIYNVAYHKRFRFVNGSWISDHIPDIAEFGVSQDNYGRLFHNSNSDHLRGSLIPIHYAERNPNHTATGSYVQLIKDQTVYPSHGTALNRGYLPNYVRADGSLRNFTAACSPLIYRGGLFPAEYDGNAFICEPVANVIRRCILTEDGISITAKNAYVQHEFVASTYERFRPVNLYNAPDGSICVIDMHHGLLQHRTHLTAYARGQYLKRELEKHMDTGRIYRILPDDPKPFEQPHLSTATNAQLIEYLSHPNGWWRDTAQRLLVERADYHTASALKKLATTSASPIARLHALWTLEGIRQIDLPTLLTAYSDSDPHNRATAIRISEPFLLTDKRATVLPALLKLAEDPSPIVTLQFAFTTSTLGDPGADTALANLLQKSGENIYIRDAVLSGLRGREMEFLDTLLASNAFASKSKAKMEVLQTLSSSIVAESKAPRVMHLLDLIARQSSSDQWRQIALMDGFPDPPKPKEKRRPLEIMLSAAPEFFLMTATNADSFLKPKTDKILSIVHWPGQPGYTPPPPPPPLSAAEQARFDAGKIVFGQTCSQCHKLDGKGQDGKAPPLLDSEWALGPATRMARIALQGLHGPITVSGKTYILEMPSFAALTDDQIASVLTYVRREWDHEASPVDPALVQKIRAETKGRIMPWTEPELLQVK